MSCNTNAVYIPENQCDDCSSYDGRIEALENGKQDKLTAGSHI